MFHGVIKKNNTGTVFGDTVYIQKEYVPRVRVKSLLLGGIAVLCNIHAFCLNSCTDLHAI